MTILRTLLWFVIAAAAMLGAGMWLAERPGAVTASFAAAPRTSVGALAVGIVVLVLVCIGLWAALSLDRGCAGPRCSRAGRQPAPPRLSRADPGPGRGRRRDGTEAQKHAQGREAFGRAARSP